MIVLTLGDKGAGKSRLLRTLAWGRLRKWKASSVIVHDPLEQWQGGHVFATCADARKYLAGGQRPRLMLIRQDSADAVCQLAWDIRNVTSVIDELDQVCTAKRWTSDAARNLAHYGRHRGVDLLGAFRFTRNVNEDLPGLADFVFLFRHSAAALYDLRTVRLRFGVEYAAQVTRMRDHETVVWSNAR